MRAGASVAAASSGATGAAGAVGAAADVNLSVSFEASLGGFVQDGLSQSHPETPAARNAPSVNVAMSLGFAETRIGARRCFMGAALILE
jgi:hypothetical protein